MLNQTIDEIEPEIAVAPAFEPLLERSRYKGAKGGRGSGKSQFFADLMILRASEQPGFRALCGREIQKSLKESAKRLLEQKITEYGLGSLFDVQETQIKTPGGGLIAFVGLQDHTSESIKSYEGFDVAWVEEAQTLSEKSLQLLRPTIRSPGSEIWFSWNPRRAIDPVDKMFCDGNPPTGSVLVTANWDSNPWFPAELEQERQDCLRDEPDYYDHIWEGGYATVTKGAYYARNIVDSRKDGRITELSRDPLMSLYAYWDIGGTGAKADACAIWIGQKKGSQVQLLDYYEAVGQELSEHVGWLKSKGYDGAEMVLPHDGATKDKVYRVSYESALQEAGFKVRVIPNQGAGAAAKRIEAARRLFPSIWFDKRNCKAGLEALGWYHEKWDEERNVGLGPDHDWSSHAADAFGLIAVEYKPPQSTAPLNWPTRGVI